MLNPYLVDSLSQWIKTNVFSTPLTALNVVDSTPQFGTLCDMFLEEGIVRENPVLFDLAVSAAAQHRFPQHRDCDKVRTWGYTVHWREWKEVFKNSVSYQGPSSKEICPICGGRNATCGMEVE